MRYSAVRAVVVRLYLRLEEFSILVLKIFRAKKVCDQPFVGHSSHNIFALGMELGAIESNWQY